MPETSTTEYWVNKFNEVAAAAWAAGVCSIYALETYDISDHSYQVGLGYEGSYSSAIGMAFRLSNTLLKDDGDMKRY